MKKITNKQRIARIKELEDQALDAFADDANFCVAEWLDDEDRKEYERLMEEEE